MLSARPIDAVRRPVRFLITNAVPLNGGDEALLRALVGGLTQRWPESRITVLCKGVESVRTFLPDMTFLPDLEFIDPPGVRRKKARRASASAGPLGGIAQRLELLVASGTRREVLRAYQEADIVLSAPGGFLNDHYSLDARLCGFELALRLGKPVVLCSQSVGPFWKDGSRQRVGEVLGKLSGLCVRDEISVEHLRECGVAGTRVQETADAAFLWRKLAPELFRERSGVPRLIALCFRAWPPGGRAETEPLVEKAVQLCRHLLAGEERRLRFLSTCQGVMGYLDDSKLARQIVDRLTPTERERVEIEERRLPPRELIRAYGECDAYVGMRLHGALLSMLGGAPAVGLGYEAKTEQIFRQLGLADYQVEFSDPVEEWLAATNRLLRDHAAVQARLGAELDRQCERAEKMLDVISECLNAGRAAQR